MTSRLLPITSSHSDMTETSVNHQYSVPTIYQRVSRTSIFE